MEAREQPKLTEEESFKESLADALAILAKIGPHCKTFEDLQQVVQLAVDDPAQLRFLLSVVKNTKVGR